MDSTPLTTTMKKILTILLVSFLIASGVNTPAEAYIERSTSAKLASNLPQESSDYRVKILREFLEKYNSPLSQSAETFVTSADENQLDWRLLASIAGLESGFGIHIPYNSYNGWGWGIYGDNVIRFSSWDEAIITISKALRERYLRDIEYSDPYIIGPPYAASPTWAQRVTFFMNSIATYQVASAKENLSISL